MIGKWFITVIILCWSVSSQAQNQEVKNVLDKVTQYYLADNEYRVEMTFTMYRGFTGNKSTERYKGTLEKKNGYSKNSILDTEVYQFPNAKLIVNSSENTITYNKAEPGAVEAPIDLSSYLEFYQKSQLLEEGNEYVCEFVTQRNNFEQMPYGKVLIYVDKNDYRVTRQVLYFSNLIPFNDENGQPTIQDYGRLVIELAHDMEKEIEQRKLADFIVKTPEGNLALQPNYADFQLIDQTEYNK
ncbi:hypothetical protein FK220_006520 [Flavobacteriaceae bacterium TP-CH-4]|uniref:Outer membrane lipoprotein-sorting protein n=1 Tax=Pelagihabitans pacificus TaxID=2696054 RepID=A0A967AT64_9FLAO|nr:hypothetical protein [Pelagihabitans pacificus]NHF58985.1 hypothetical protein [Pelagihabitans pacificus]